MTPPIQIRRRDEALRARVDADLRDAAARAGARLACRPGCTECCIGPFPITALDARRLRDGLAALRESRPERASALGQRAQDAAARLSAAFPGDARRGLFDDDEAAQERFCAAFAALPCPVLDPETGWCDLYEHRPLSCRTFGPPVRLGGEDLAPCRLCFVGCDAAEIESCRVEPRVEAEAELLRDIGEPRETVVAFALAGSQYNQDKPDDIV